MHSFSVKTYDGHSKIIIYGAGLFGEITLRCLEQHGLRAYCFADRNNKIYEKCGLKVISPAEIKNYDGAYVLIASINYILDMQNFLVKEGIENFYDVSLLLSTEIDNAQLSEYAKDTYMNIARYSREIKNIAERRFSVQSLDLVVTEFCNLRCKNCGSLIPMHNNPRHYPAKTVATSLSRFMECVDELGELRILGGETFVYPYLEELLHLLDGVPKIIKKIIYTNSTIIPPEGVMKMISQSNVFIHMSNYGSISSCLEKLKKRCSEFGVAFYAHDYEVWRDMGGLKCRNYSEEQAQEIFLSCDNAHCLTLMNSRVYICPRAAQGEEIGAFQNAVDEYVDLSQEGNALENRKKLHMMLDDRKYFNACLYCNGSNMHNKPIKAAVQLT